MRQVLIIGDKYDSGHLLLIQKLFFISLPQNTALYLKNYVLLRIPVLKTSENKYDNFMWTYSIDPILLRI